MKAMRWAVGAGLMWAAMTGSVQAEELVVKGLSVGMPFEQACARLGRVTEAQVKTTIFESETDVWVAAAQKDPGVALALFLDQKMTGYCVAQSHTVLVAGDGAGEVSFIVLPPPEVDAWFQVGDMGVQEYVEAFASGYGLGGFAFEPFKESPAYQYRSKEGFAVIVFENKSTFIVRTPKVGKRTFD